MTKKLTIGVIGLGSIGIRHARNLEKLGHRVIGYDPIKELQNQFNGDSTLSEDAYVIASPTPCHYDDILNFSPLNKPIFIEKPIAHRMIISDSITMVGYNLCFHGAVKKAKEWIDQGKLGTPLWANFTLAQHSIKEPYLRDGVILNWSHEIYLALYLLGPAKMKGSSTRLTDGKDDICDILLIHDNGCHSTVHLDYVAIPELRRTIIVGTRNAITIDLVEHYAVLVSPGKKIVDQARFSGDWNQDYIDEMKAFIERCDNKRTLGCTPSMALDVLTICLQARKEAGL